MTDAKKPTGYENDKKGAAGGTARATASPESRIRPDESERHGKTIKFELDGKTVEAGSDETIWQVANRLGTEIPHLCYTPEPGYRPDGNCRACMVEIEGERVLAASCLRKPAEGMKVRSASERAKASRKMVFELLVADQPERETAHDPQSKFWNWTDKMGIADEPLPAARQGRARSQPHRDGGQSRRLHPVQSLRPRLPRSAGQRRDRHGRSRPS